jgi:hypothetical protein
MWGLIKNFLVQRIWDEQAIHNKIALFILNYQNSIGINCYALFDIHY